MAERARGFEFKKIIKWTARVIGGAAVVLASTSCVGERDDHGNIVARASYDRSCAAIDDTYGEKMIFIEKTTISITNNMGDTVTADLGLQVSKEGAKVAAGTIDGKEVMLQKGTPQAYKGVQFEYSKTIGNSIRVTC